MSRSQRCDQLELTPEHPFSVKERSDAQRRPKLVGHEDLNSNWVGAGHLKIGDTIKQADGTVGVVANGTTIQQPQEMFNLTVDEAHTFYVGTNGWLVHNTGPCFGLKVASEGAVDAAQNLGSYNKVKHLATTGGSQAKFNVNTLADQNALIDEALRSSSAAFTTNGTSARSFTMVVDMGRTVGTKGEQFIKVVVGYPEGGGSWRVWSAFPVKK